MLGIYLTQLSVHVTIEARANHKIPKANRHNITKSCQLQYGMIVIFSLILSRLTLFFLVPVRLRVSFFKFPLLLLFIIIISFGKNGVVIIWFNVRVFAFWLIKKNITTQYIYI